MPSQGGMTVLPQFQGDYYQLQNQQALAQALMSQAMQNRAPQQTVGSGQYQVMPKMSPLSGMSQLAEAYLAAKMGQNVGQGYNQLGQKQYDSMMDNGTGSSTPGGLNFTMPGGAQGGQATPSDVNSGAGFGGSGMTPQSMAQGVARYSNGGGASMQTDPTGAAIAQSSPSAASALGYQGAQPQQPQAQQDTSPFAPGGSANPGGLPKGRAVMNYLQLGAEKYSEQYVAPYYKPTEATLMARAAGADTASANAGALAKANYIAPTSMRPGGYAVYANGTQEQMPQVPEGFTAVRGANNQWQMVPVQGGTGAMAASSAAKASGNAQYQLTDAWDPTANGGQGGMVHQSVANAANSANGGGSPGMPLPLRNNNPGAVSPGGSVAQYPDMQTGLAAMDKNLASYANDPKVKTMGDAITKWVGSPPNAPPYIKDVSARLGIPPNTPIDLTNPAQRQALGTAIMLHENGPSAVFGNGGGRSAPQQGGPMASQPPLGVTTAANASQGAPSKLMADSYGSMSTADANYQQSREALTQMIQLANKKGPGGSVIGVLPSQIGTKISPEAAEYQKLHATYVSQQGKALGSGGTDASRANIDESVPTYDKPQSAMISGLNTQLNNLDLAHLKTQYLTPTYQQGDEKAFTQKSAAFDQNVAPAMVPLLTMPAGPQRAAALKQAIANPQMKSRLDWAVQNGLLK